MGGAHTHRGGNRSGVGERLRTTLSSVLADLGIEAERVSSYGGP